LPDNLYYACSSREVPARHSKRLGFQVNVCNLLRRGLEY
jgi:hypothetical protein